jgi:hypothetical protein
LIPSTLVRLSPLALLPIVLSATILANAATSLNSNPPLFFEPNQGQAPAQARYLLHDGTSQAFFQRDGVSLILPQSNDTAFNLGIQFVGANPNPEIAGLSPLTGKSNYLLGNDPSKWLRGLPNYSQIRYREIYSGIDLLFYGNGHSLEHDFEVEPGADPARIAFRLNGAKNLAISAAGDLEVHLPGGVLVLQKPRAYQDSSVGRKIVDAQFALAADGTVSFQLGAFDAGRKLVIDPVLTFNTYLGVYSAIPTAVATDAAGDTYVTGTTISPSYPAYPVTPGAFQTTCPGCENQSVIFITKFDPTGSTQLYSTLLGGSDAEPGYDGDISQWYPRIAVDGSGNAIVAGYTVTTDFPIKNPVEPSPAIDGAPVAFVASLTPDGSALNYSTLLGTSSPDNAPAAVAVDANDYAYFTGVATVAGFPVTPGAFNGATGTPNTSGVFISKFSPSGALAYSAMIGDVELDSIPSMGARGIAVDSQGNAYIAGGAGPGWPVTAGAYLTQLPANFDAWVGGEVFATKLSADGSTLDYSTFVGTGQAMGIALDAKDNAYIAGTAVDNTFPTTSNAYFINIQACCGTYYQVYSFFSQIGPDGSSLVYSSYYPGQINAMTVDKNGNIWLAGFPAYDTIPLQYPLDSLDSNNSFVSEFDPSGTKLEFSTFFYGTSGATAYDGFGYGNPIVIDPAGRAHVAGSTFAPMFTTPNAFSSSVPPTPAANTYTTPYGRAAIIDPSQAAPSLCLGTDMTYGWIAVQNNVAASTFKVTNCGNAPLTIESFTPSEQTAFTVPAAGNQCTGSVAPGNSCTVEILYVYAPNTSCIGALTITSNASISSVTIPLWGSAPQTQPCTQFVEESVASLNFNSQLLGTTSAPQTVTVTNPTTKVIGAVGTPPFEISISGDFSETDTCGILAPLSSCTFSVAFTPTAAGSRAGTLTIYPGDWQPSYDVPVQIPLTGTGVAPASAAALSAASLTFPAQAIGTTSAVQTVTLTNSGQLPLSIASIVASGDFAQTNTCGAAVPAGSACVLSVTFSPTADGSRTGAVAITDNAADSPQTVSLTGAGPAMTVSTASTGLTVSSPGGTATATIQLTPSGSFSGAVNLACTVTYAGAGSATDPPTCSFNPSQVTLAGASSASAVLTVSTTATTSSRGSGGDWRRAEGLLAAMLFLGIAPLRRRKGWPMLVFLCILAATALQGCGGGGSGGSGGGNAPPQNQGTSQGTYAITVTATSGTLTASVSIPLSVQ